ncbi:MAG: transketolase family protein [Candidatus Omnitrophica bacterium]|nr:transketolase family protein [Candidatus Omnitrophota bacterium]MBU3933705.1 transketolase family protein [Candidatus Omnitrophota bacterium]MBU4141230.1 transketolase family protein [Candidatus Omnitrophota bacterium]
MSEMLYARDAYGQALIELGGKNKEIVALDADLSGSTRTAGFGKKFPRRFFDFGVAEQNMMGVAAGLASCGKIPFVSTFAIFGSGRAWDQVRNTICYNKFNVKIVVTHAGITVGPDGSSHQAIGDIALMRAIANMTIIVPCDAPETKEAICACAEYQGPVYVRLGRPKVPTLAKKDKFKIGRARILREGKDISIIACGMMLKQALDAAEVLEKEGLSARVVNMHTIRPLDKKAILECARLTKRIVTCEEHLLSGGLGSAVASVLVENIPTPVAMIGIRDRFGQSGSPEDLIKEYHLSTDDVLQACRRLL